jgi:Lipocalin-like domain
MDPKTMNAKNRRTTLTRTAFAFLCLGIALSASKAVGQKPLKELIVGTWFLDAVYDETQDGEKHNPWGDGVKGQAIFTSDGHFSWQMMSANRPKADTSPREPVGPVVAYWGTYTVDEAAKTLTDQLERCTFPQWDGITGTLNLVSPTENELNMTTTKSIPDPKMGPFVPHINWKRAN